MGNRGNEIVQIRSQNIECNGIPTFMCCRILTRSIWASSLLKKLDIIFNRISSLKHIHNVRKLDFDF